MTVRRLCCRNCGAGLVPTWTGLHCPRLGACGRGGHTETALSLLPVHLGRFVPTGVHA